MKKLVNLTKEDAEKLDLLLKTHRKSKGNANLFSRIIAIKMLNRGDNFNEVALLLCIHEDTLSSYIEKFNSGKDEELCKLLYVGKKCMLSAEEIKLLVEFVDSDIFMSVKPIVEYVKKKFNKEYSDYGMVSLLKSNGFTFKKPCTAGAKAVFKEQEDHIEKCNELRKIDKEKEVIVYMDGVHPQHNTHKSYGWMRKGQESKFIPSNPGRQRVNILGAVDIDNEKLFYVEVDTISYPAVIDLLKILMKAYPGKIIHVFTDNAPYNHATKLNEFIAEQGGRIVMHYIPPYSPNLNIIERLWRLLRKKAIGHNYFAKFEDFKKNICNFLENCWIDFREEMKKIMNYKFHLLPKHAYKQ